MRASSAEEWRCFSRHCLREIQNDMRTPWLISLLCVFVLAACGDDEGERVCVPGVSVSCVGAGGCTGGQICLPSGEGFGECDCGDAGTPDTGRDVGEDTAVDSEVPDSRADSADADEGDMAADVPVDAPVDAPNPDDCDPVANTGCPDGERCTFVVTNADSFEGITTCAPIGSTADGERCTATPGDEGSDDCSAGSTCDGSLCVQICGLEDEDACTGCAEISALFPDRENVGVCPASCDPLAAVNCSPGLGCYYTGSELGFVCVPDASVEDAGIGSPCEFFNDCPSGLHCSISSGPTTSECRYPCNTVFARLPTCDDVDGPGEGFTCRAFFGEGEGEPANFGLCIESD